MPGPAGAPTPPDATASLRDWTAWKLAEQARSCASLGSPLYATLLRAASADVVAEGPAWDVLGDAATRDTGDALALRLMAAVHRLVLTRRAPALALHYPSVGGTAGIHGAADAFLALLAERRDDLAPLVALPCQTNEVGRCAALVPGFLTVAAASRRPLRLLEVGASAGLNLRWDHYRYVDGERTWGDPAAEVVVAGRWEVPAALLATPVTVTSREGCDPRPVDPRSDDGRFALSASMWADQTERFERLAAALRVAARVPATVAAATVADWLPERLAEPTDGAATVVYHSAVWQYLSDGDRAAMHAALARAAAGATVAAPLAWLRMEPEPALHAMAVRLTTWPGGDDQLLATAGAHGLPLSWQS